MFLGEEEKGIRNDEEERRAARMPPARENGMLRKRGGKNAARTGKWRFGKKVKILKESS